MYKEKDLGCLTQMFRYLLILVNVAFFIGGLAGVVVAGILYKQRDDNLLHFCHVCKNFSVVLLVACLVLCGFAALGVCSLWKRNTCLLLLYCFFLICFFLTIFAATIGVIMMRAGKFDDKIKDAWEDLVQDDPNSSCDFMIDVHCSGWEKLCTNDTSLLNNRTCPNCTNRQHQAEISTYNVTCKKMLEDDVRGYFTTLIVGGFILMFITICSVMIAWKVRSQYEDYNELENRF